MTGTILQGVGIGLIVSEAGGWLLAGIKLLVIGAVLFAINRWALGLGWGRAAGEATVALLVGVALAVTTEQAPQEPMGSEANRGQAVGSGPKGPGMGPGIGEPPPWI